MKLNNQVLIGNFVLFFLIFVSFAAADVDNGSVIHKGEATFYGENGLGHCGFTTVQPQYHGAMNHIDYDSSAACGTWVQISGPRGDVITFIDDECPECKEGDIDLGPRTFEVIADRSLGRVPITWHYVSAPVDGPIQYFWKDGTSQHHLEIQVRNHRYGITKLEMQTQTSDWIELTREPYNFFRKFEGINREIGPYNIRVTDINGTVLVDSLIDLIPEATINGKANFPDVSSSVKSYNVHKKNYSQKSNLHISIGNPIHSKVINGLVNVYTINGQYLYTSTENRMMSAAQQLRLQPGVVILESIRNEESKQEK
jgi:expansin (peptidoglycan-binding protein)